MELPLLTGLRADIVPHSQWATRKWFYAHPLWYYHRPGTDEEIVANRKFYQLVDPELKALCRLLNDHGVHTTPSCQGHFYPRERFERIWEQLTREAKQIGGQGLVVKDSETDRPFCLREAGYALPWKRFDDFYAQAADHQGTGYLGIVIPEDRPALIARLCRMSGRRGIVTTGFDEQVSQSLGGRLYNILVRPSSNSQRARTWREVTRVAEDILRREQTSPAGQQARSCDASGRIWAN